MSLHSPGHSLPVSLYQINHCTLITVSHLISVSPLLCPLSCPSLRFVAQLFHQGRVVPVDFIGFVKSQRDVEMKGETVSNHDELMCNFFAQVSTRTHMRICLVYPEL